MNETLAIKLDAGSETDAMSKYILAQLTDDEIDEIEVKRTLAPQSGLANEPVTVGIIVVASIKAVTAIAGAITAYLNYRAKQIEAQKSQTGNTTTALPTPKFIILDGPIPPALAGIPGVSQSEVSSKP
jgi:hypothetical protein